MFSLLHPREASREVRKADIKSPDVYAARELAPGSYILDASIGFGQPFARAVVTCDAGHATFWGITAKFIFDLARLNELGEADGKTLVRHRLCSAGMQPDGPRSPRWVGDRECPTEQ
jgi:hypothetical protein